MTTLMPLSDGQTFRLNEAGDGPLWILDAAPGTAPRIAFVPAIPSTDNTEEAAQ
jgi:hypothetical protein